MEGKQVEHILITGGLGYIGSHTVVELVTVHDEKVIIVDNLDNSDIKCLKRLQDITGKPDSIIFFELDLLNEQGMNDKIFSQYKIKSCIHFAGLKAVGESVKKPLEYYNNNVSGTVTLLRLMQKYKVNCFLFSSSACVYGENPACTENTPVYASNIMNPYGQTKAMVEQIMKDWAASDPDVCAIALRYFNPIGAHPSGQIGESPKDIPNNLMPYIMRVANGHLPHLGVFGNDYKTVDGTGVRDYIHVTDLAKGHTAALAKQDALSGYNVFNLGTGNGTSVLQLVAAFQKASGVEIKTVMMDRRQGDAETVLAIPEKANTQLQWKTELSIEDACRDNWNWARQNPNGYSDGEAVQAAPAKPKKAPKPLPAEYIMKAEAPKAVAVEDQVEEKGDGANVDAMAGFDAFDDY